MQPINRRDFLKRSLLTTVALSLPARSWAVGRGSQQRHSHGRDWLQRSRREPHQRLRLAPGRPVGGAVRRRQVRAGARSEKLRERNLPIETYTDVRKLLENKEIDAISTATPNHWHALISIWACQAGKDVRRKARLPQCLGRQENRRSSAQSITGLCRLAPSAAPAAACARRWNGCARAISARFWSRAVFATNAGAALAKSMARKRFRPRSITICGAARRPKGR